MSKLPPVPRLSLRYKRITELTFSGTVAAAGNLTVVAGPIGYPFRIIKAKMVFDDEANNLVQFRWFISGNAIAPATAPPPDVNIFSRENPTSSFIGKAMIKNINTNIEVEEPNRYLKMYVFNGCLYAYIANGTLVIQEL